MAEPRKPSAMQVLHNAAASLVVVAVVGIWNAAANTSNQLDRLTDTMEGVRRDVDRHESIFLRFGYGVNSLQPEPRAPAQNL